MTPPHSGNINRQPPEEYTIVSMSFFTINSRAVASTRHSTKRTQSNLPVAI